jgi:hypothetical protein
MLLLCCLAAFFLCACAHKDTADITLADAEEPEVSPEEMQQLAAALRAELVMKSLAEGYPDRVTEAVVIDGDWTVEVDGTRFYYAGGKLLPEELLAQEAEYTPLLFYRYSEELLPWTPPSAEAIERMRMPRQSTTSTPRMPRKRSIAFFDTLFQGASRDEVILHLKYIDFLGETIRVHESITDELAAIDAQLKVLAVSDAETGRWMRNISDITTWNWRNIAGTSSKSFHSYATAIDIQEKPQTGKHSYWLWSAQNGLSWWEIPYEDRQHPPDAVVKLFESYGFVWGGKWAQFDTMHFEYRPEVLLINGLSLDRNESGPK